MEDLEMLDWDDGKEVNTTYTTGQQGSCGGDLQLGSDANTPGIPNNDAEVAEEFYKILHLEQEFAAYAIIEYERDDIELEINSDIPGIPNNYAEVAEEFNGVSNQEQEELTAHMVIEYELDGVNQQLEIDSDILGVLDNDAEAAEEFDEISHREQEELAAYEVFEHEPDASILGIPDNGAEAAEEFDGMLDRAHDELAIYEIAEREQGVTVTQIGVDIDIPGIPSNDIEIAEEFDEISTREQEELAAYIVTENEFVSGASTLGIPDNNWAVAQEFSEMEMATSPSPPEGVLPDSESEPLENLYNRLAIVQSERIQPRPRVVRAVAQQYASVSNPVPQRIQPSILRGVNRHQRHPAFARSNHDSTSAGVSTPSERSLRRLRAHILAVTEAQVRLMAERSYSYPLSDSDSEDENIPEGSECSICQRRLAKVGFRGCIHRACASCVKGIWHSRKRAESHFPDWFPCHQCRAEIKEVGMVSAEPYEFGPVLSNGSFIIDLTDPEWVPIRQWMAKRSKKVAEGCRRYLIPLALHTPVLRQRRVRPNPPRNVM